MRPIDRRPFDVSIRLTVYAEDQEEAKLAVAELLADVDEWSIQFCSPTRITHA